MSRRDDNVILQHIIDHGRQAMRLSQGRVRVDLDDDELFSLAMVRLVEIIGEAANQLSEARRSQFPNVPWRQIIATRNVIVHAYSTIDYDIIWNILTIQIPDLLRELQSNMKGDGEP